MRLNPCIVYVATILAAPLTVMSLPLSRSSISVSIPAIVVGDTSAPTQPVEVSGANLVSKRSSDSHLQRRASGDPEQLGELDKFAKNFHGSGMDVAAGMTRNWYAHKNALESTQTLREAGHVDIKGLARYIGKEQELTHHFQTLDEAGYIDPELKKDLDSVFGIKW